GRRINVERLEREGSGYVARHEPDIALSADTWFRGIDLNYGPDGAVYLLDWSDTGECHEHDGVHRLSGRIFRIANGETAEEKDLKQILEQVMLYESKKGKTAAELEKIRREVSIALLERSGSPRRSLTSMSSAGLVQAHALKGEWIVRHARRELADRLRKGE